MLQTNPQGEMRILRAGHLGMCFGVRDAIALALNQAEKKPLTILGDLVHNEAVMASLQERGIRVQHDPGTVTTPTVMITAHGASERMMNRVRERGLKVVEATCPLVRFAHRMLAKLVREGLHPVIIGQRGHVEVRGLTEDLAEFDVVVCEADVIALNERRRFGVVAQTTQPIDKVRRLVAFMERRFPDSEVRLVDTVCQPTKQRQSAAIALAKECDAVIVIGGANSNNTRELAATCRLHCPRVYHVQTAMDLRPEWLVGVETLGITAGTSTPDALIDTLENSIRRIAAKPPEPFSPVQAMHQSSAQPVCA